MTESSGRVADGLPEPREMAPDFEAETNQGKFRFSGLHGSRLVLYRSAGDGTARLKQSRNNSPAAS